MCFKENPPVMKKHGESFVVSETLATRRVSGGFCMRPATCHQMPLSLTDLIPSLLCQPGSTRSEKAFQRFHTQLL